MGKEKLSYELSVDAKELIAAEPTAKVTRHGKVYPLASLTQQQLEALKDTQYVVVKE